MKHIVGLIPDRDSLADARTLLQNAGIGESHISVLNSPAEVWDQLGGRNRLRLATRYTLFGALLGLFVGLLYGVPAGIMNCSETGCPFVTSAALTVVITVYWVIGGAFMGAIIGADRLEQHFYSYVEGVRRGEPLLLVETPDERSVEISRLLREKSTLLVHALEDE